MYWWLGIWMVVVTVALGSVAVSVIAQMMDWEFQKLLAWLRGSPEGWGARMIHAMKGAQEWATKIAEYIFTLAAFFRSREGMNFASWKKLIHKLSEDKVNASFYRSLYRSMRKNTPPHNLLRD